jgi:nucleotide-binding universal stress UspA family protein
MMLKRVLVPVDGSESAKRALHYAVDLTRLAGGAEILLVHCHRSFPRLLGEPYLQAAINAIQEDAEQIVAPFREILESSGAQFSECILEGAAWEKIVEAAEIEKCDLIVMGSRGCSDLKGLVVGSVTHRVLHATPCPVLVVR